MNILTISQSNFTSSFWEENVWNFSQSECIIGPDSHVEFKISTKKSWTQTWASLLSLVPMVQVVSQEIEM